ncbi:uncharacterized protein B0H18DRAFT_878025 [Fomitopsis serialis]|uniref:uncharacterized protein n=1 Tax=Fomitopsis serialis TaxID=139415 RepID=UPI002007FD42|nr:uncharacterized protein B0H18DRAFT_878025 [Neoantrodia serialis]KAH9924419.1 hypothetical protein B0H18DRAFT_878025 [Neoantrodia serialis]
MHTQSDGSGLRRDGNRNILPLNAPPPPRTSAAHGDYTPYRNRLEFELAGFLFKKAQMSGANIDELLDLWAASLIPFGAEPPFANRQDLYNIIDSTTIGDAPWESFTVQYTGELPEGEVPEWMTTEYQVWTRNARTLVHFITENVDFEGQVDVAPYRLYDNAGKRYYIHCLSGDWAWRQADIIAADTEHDTYGAMFTPIILGSDKTTVSVATGQNEYYPLYLSTGNVHNNVRRAHRNAVVILAFLAIPKTEKKHAQSKAFRHFRRQLYHSSISVILDPLKPYMREPDFLRCWDGYYRTAIYSLGPFTGDYPEQALCACVVYGWCVTCPGDHKNLDEGLLQGRRTREHTELLIKSLDEKTLWEDYGIVSDIIPFSNDLPRADIHELLSGDILHQIIKGCFMDHLVTWIGQYLVIVHGEAKAKEIMDEIDRRIAAVPPFPGLRHFHQGRDFKQWTGDDSKALMKVYLPAIHGLLPPRIILTMSTFLDICYLVRKPIQTEDTIAEVERLVTEYHHHREIFREAGVCPDGFSFPRQHSVAHYPRHTRNFGAMLGLCTSITESKHIVAVKKPWRRSNHHNALGQMLLTNQRLDKLAASRVDFTARGMLDGTVLSQALRQSLQRIDNEAEGYAEGEEVEEEDVPEQSTEEPQAAPRSMLDDEERSFAELGVSIGHPELPTLVARFLFWQRHPDHLDEPSDSTLERYVQRLTVGTRVSVFNSAVATFFAPTDAAGESGMRRERIRATRSWRGSKSGRYDCVFINKDESQLGFRALHVARIRLLFSFRQEQVLYPCALIQWFVPLGDAPDEDARMWIVEPEFDEDGQRPCEVVHLDTIMRLAHPIPVYGENFLPRGFNASDSLDAFRAYWINKWIDHNAHDIAF